MSVIQRVVVPDAQFSIADQILNHAQWAANHFQKMNINQVRIIVQAVVDVAIQHAEEFATMTVEETGFGVVEHKKIKNIASAKNVWNFYAQDDYVTPTYDQELQKISLPKPAGVVFALTPATNPIATLIYKTIIALLGRNVVVFSPHPRAEKTSIRATKILHDAAVAAGAPHGVIQCLSHVDISLIKYVLASDKIAVTLATGGGAMVRSAYSSGNPAIGVGSGNAPVFIDESADLKTAVKYIVESKSFDNSVLCTNESVLIVLDNIKEQILRYLKTENAHICNEHEVSLLRNFMFPGGKFNIDILGKSAAYIAEKAGLRIYGSPKVLITPIQLIGIEEPLSGEKLCPVLALKTVKNIHQAIRVAHATLRKRGEGHSAAFHGENYTLAMQFATELNVYRLVINAPCSLGASGFDTYLPPSFMIGTGYAGKSSIGENVGPQHLVHWTQIAISKHTTLDVNQFVLLNKDQFNETVDNHFTPSLFDEKKVSIDASLLRQLVQEELAKMERGK